jgi:hypothetical protein
MKKLEDLLIYKKAMVIGKLVESLMLAIPENDVFLMHSKELMIEDALVIPSKIAGAEGGDLYSIRMQNAAIIRYHSLHLYAQIGSLRFHSKFKDLEYVTLIRKELDEFRLLFIDWVASFDTTNHLWDDWGLFNPPNATPPNYFNDDDINIDDFLNDE